MKNLYAVACLALVLAVLGSSRAATSAEKNFPRLALYERFVAIDEACGWPLVTVLPDGALGCLIWPVPLHGFTEGAVECWKSTDDGRAWRTPVGSTLRRRGFPRPDAGRRREGGPRRGGGAYWA